MAVVLVLRYLYLERSCRLRPDDIVISVRLDSPNCAGELDNVSGIKLCVVNR
jgi:hypothetical protein